jgi:hypothetical protein
MQNDAARTEDVIVSLLLNNFNQTSKWIVLLWCSSRWCLARSAPCSTPWSRIKVSGVRNSSTIFLAVILKILLITFDCLNQLHAGLEMTRGFGFVTL